MENIEKGKRKKITVALWVVLALKNNCSNNSSSPRTFISLNFICVFLCVFIFKSLLVVNPFARSLVLSPTLYKFIVLGSLGSYPRSFGLGLQIVTLQLAPSVRRACARVRVTVDDGKTRSTTSRIEGIITW